MTVTLFDAFPQDFNLEEPLFVIIDDLAVPLFCDSFVRRGRSGATVVFSDIYTERRAGEFVGKLLHLDLGPQDDDDDDAPDGRIYLEDMIGWSATVDGLQGRIEEFIDGENPLFGLIVNGREVYVPAVEEFMAEIDTDKRSVTFELPEGLLELYME